MITFRLVDSMPVSRRSEWSALFGIKDGRCRRKRIEDYLDAGYGECWLRNPEIAFIVEDSLLHFDSERYRLLAWCIMPNHVHTIVEVWDTPMEKIVRSWKNFTARQANERLSQSGAFWQPDFWDTRIRDEQHFVKAARYIEGNPARAHLVARAELWPFSSANPKWTWAEGGLPARYSGESLLSEARGTGVPRSDRAAQDPERGTPVPRDKTP